jgi:hypothetical protein
VKKEEAYNLRWSHHHSMVWLCSKVSLSSYFTIVLAERRIQLHSTPDPLLVAMVLAHEPGWETKGATEGETGCDGNRGDETGGGDENRLSMQRYERGGLKGAWMRAGTPPPADWSGGVHACSRTDPS